MRKVIRNTEDYNNFLDYVEKKYVGTGDIWIAEWTKKPKKRSVKANALLHMWIQSWCNSQGEKNNKGYFEVVKDEIKKMFLPDITITGLTGNCSIPKPTSQLNTKEFSEFLENIHKYFLEEHSYCLPWPEDRYFEEMYQARRV